MAEPSGFGLESLEKPDNNNLTNTLEFLHHCFDLKTTKRTGWLLKGICDGESIADHMYRMAIIAMLVPTGNTAVDRDRCVRMALVHDLAEAIVGDITPECGISRDEKHRMELDAIRSMTGLLPDAQAAEICGLWTEYEADTTNEAQLVKDIDKFEFALQTFEYERGRQLKMDRFFDEVGPKLRNGFLRNLYSHLSLQRSS